MKKLISTLTALSLAVMACSPGSQSSSKNTNPETPEKPGQHVKPQVPVAWQNDFDALVKVLDAKYPHLGVAEYVAQSLTARYPNIVSEIKAQSDAVLLLQDRTSAEAKEKFEFYFLGDSRGRNNLAFMSNIIAGEKVDKSAFHNRIQIQTVSLAQGAALRKIFDIFNEQLDKNTDQLAREMIDDLSKNEPKVVQAIDGLISEDTRLQAKMIREILIKYDRILAKYDFDKEDSMKIVIYGLVAHRLMTVLKENSTVKAILKTVEKIQEVHKKVREIQFTLAAMEKYRKEMKKNWEDVSSSFKAMKEDLEYYNVQMRLSEKSKKAVGEVLYDIFDGTIDEPEKNAKKKSILSQDHPLDKNVAKFVNSTAAAAQSFDKIVGSISNLAAALGVEVPAEVQKIIETAQKVSAGIQIGAAVVNAFSSGGMLGVATAFSGGPAAMVLGGLGGLGGDDATAAALAAIKKDLQEVKRMQKETLELQRASMRMLRELAVMIDENHRESLYVMESIYREVKSVKELEGLAAERDLRACQEIVLSASYGFRSEDSFSLSLRDVMSIKNEIKRNVTSLEELESLIRNSADGDWQNCQSFLSSTFSVMDRNSLIYARLAYRSDKQSGVALEEDLYRPAWEFLTSEVRGHWLYDMNLHLPVNTMAALRKDKSQYLRSNSSSSELDRSSLESLLAPETLERYIATLLASQTLVSLNADQWTNLPKNLNSARDRAERWLRPALRQVHIAIAQEAILAGEPLLDLLASEWITLTTEKANCNVEKGSFCFARQNTLMMKNLLTYMLYQKRQLIETTGSYKNQVADLLGMRVDRFGEKDGKLYFYLSDKGFAGLVAEVPNREAVLKGQISYSENMLKLIEMQNMLASELSRLSIKGEGRAVDLAKLLILQAI